MKTKLDTIKSIEAEIASAGDVVALPVDVLKDLVADAKAHATYEARVDDAFDSMMRTVDADGVGNGGEEDVTW